MFYLLLLTKTTLCLTDNNYVPIEFKDCLSSVHTFDSLDEAYLYLHKTLCYDDMWDFGLLLFPHTELELGKVYHR